jgi:hypothetical protein
MSEIGIVQQVSGEWIAAARLVRLRIEADGLDHPQDVLIAPQDVQSLIGLLLRLSGKAGPADDVPSYERTIRPVAVDSIALGSTDDGAAILELNVGRTTLAFFLPSGACGPLGQTLLTLTATPTRTAN